jgi:two-component system chemotaxis response regulator CheB
MAAGKIRVLIVDDSALYREVLALLYASDPTFEVVGAAADPFEARDLILRHHPDVMTCDVEMPRMNGIEFIRRLLPQYEIPIVVVSSIGEAALDALSAGAVDFVAKPNPGAGGLLSFAQELRVKTVAASKARRAQRQPAPVDGEKETEELRARSVGLIAVGASTGGTEAISRLLKELPPDLPGIVIVQHIPPVFSRMFADRLDQQTRLKVREARTGDPVLPGTAYVAPGDRHVRVRKHGDVFKLECFPGDKVSGHRPSVDVLFDSVAKEAGDSAIGVLLTGMGYDGAKGLLAMRRKGAFTIGQDEASSVVYGMPRAAFELGAVRKVSPLHRIPQLLTMLCRQ